MSDQLTLAAETRDRVGKGASRSLRRDGRVPAVIYGDNQDPTPIHVEEKALTKLLMTGFFMNSVRSEEHTSELQSLMRISYAVFCLKKKKHKIQTAVIIHYVTN